MLNTTQEKWIIEQLRENGSISRNKCLRNYISRLGAIIFQLKEKGWEFEGDYVKTDFGRDYIYKVKSKPEEEKKREGHWEETPNGMKFNY